MTMKTASIYENNYSSLKVAMCQILTREWDVEGNTARTLDALQLAAEKGAELAITPECVIHGYGFDTADRMKERMYEVAQRIDGKIIKSICNKVKELNIYAIVGFAELDEDNRIHNSSILISNKGEIVYLYRKVHCRDFEDIKHQGQFSAGEHFYSEPISFDQGIFNIGTMICFDREIPESVRCLRKIGAELIACPLATNTSDMYVNDDIDNEIITRCRAAENEVFIAVVNHAGTFNGGSFIVGPGGEVLHQMGSEEDIAVIDVPLGVLKEKFHNNPLGWMGFGFRRPEIYRKYLDD